MTTENVSEQKGTVQVLSNQYTNVDKREFHKRELFLRTWIVDTNVLSKPPKKKDATRMKNRNTW